MTQAPPSPAERPQPRPASNSPSEDAFHAPPIAAGDTPDGPDVSDQPGAEAGHYGPGYYDPTRHQGGEPPGAGTPLEKTLNQPAADSTPLQQAMPDTDPGAAGETDAPDASRGGQQ